MNHLQAFLLCWASVYATGQSTIGLEEMTCDFVISSSSAHSKTLLVAPRYRRGGLPEINLYLYDFSTGEARNLTDRRMQTTVLLQVLPRKTGFSIWDHYTGTVFHLNQDGSLEKTLKLNRFEGYEPRFRSTHVFPLDGLVALVTMVDTRGNGRYRLVISDSERENLSTLHEVSVDDSNRCFWIPHQEKLLFVVPESGKIASLEMTTLKPIKTLRPEEDGFRRKGQDRPLLTLPILGDRALYMVRNRFEDERGRSSAKPEKDVLELSLEKGQVRIGLREVVVGAAENELLLFDIENQTFRVQSR